MHINASQLNSQIEVINLNNQLARKYLFCCHIRGNNERRVFVNKLCSHTCVSLKVNKVQDHVSCNEMKCHNYSIKKWTSSAE